MAEQTLPDHNEQIAVEPEVPKLSLNRTECAQAMRVGIRSIDTLIAGRRGNGFPVAYVGTKPTIPVRELEDWLSRRAKGGRTYER